jgi:hypothetical protein
MLATPTDPDTISAVLADPVRAVAVLRALDPAAVRARLDLIARERAALLLLLRAARRSRDPFAARREAPARD